MKLGSLLVSLITVFMMVVLLPPVAAGTLAIGLFMALINVFRFFKIKLV